MPWTNKPIDSDVLKGIKLLVLDVDGVLTKGEIAIISDGTEMRLFNSQDGVGLMVAYQAGLQTAIITGRATEAVRKRAEEVKITHIVMGTFAKLKPLLELCNKLGLSPKEVAYVGDDVPDIPPMKQVGFAVAVANAVEEVKKTAHYITERAGGEGAVRETIELILQAQGKWEKAVGEFIGDLDWHKGL
ncbi:MAG: HAD hydrolase family protein [Armatimonadetes bacterium]|nr:HAD hydrolase family protein [Armatimonadota bacterium]MDW8028772.1 HAD hydrolase family protein [Armatimonadota bacterium]